MVQPVLVLVEGSAFSVQVPLSSPLNRFPSFKSASSSLTASVWFSGWSLRMVAWTWGGLSETDSACGRIDDMVFGNDDEQPSPDNCPVFPTRHSRARLDTSMDVAKASRRGTDVAGVRLREYSSGARAR